MRHLLRPLPLALAGMLAVGAVGLGVAVDRLSPERTDAIELVTVDDEFAREEDLPAELRVEPPADDDEDLERRRADRWAATRVDIDDTSDGAVAPVTTVDTDDTDDTAVAVASADQSDDAPTRTALPDDSDDGDDGDDAPATSSTTTTPVGDDDSVDDDASADEADDESGD